MKKRVLAAFVLCMSMFAPAAFAQQTGSISGIVLDKAGTGVPGATVRITGELLPGGRSTASSDNGLYNFPLLIPGKYTVAVEKTGLGTATREAVVEVGRDTQLDLAIGVVTETVTVTGAAPAVDLKNTEVNFNYQREFIQALPLDRSYSGLFALIPGVAENGGFAPNGGGSRQDNTYLIDGVNITNPLFGYLSTEVNEFDIAEFNVKRGAITAEFGRSSGFVSNAVTRSGSNQFRGGLRFEAIPNNWIAKSDKTIRSATDRWVGAFNAGGRIIADRVFWYGSGRYARSETTGRVNNFGPIPDRLATTTELFGKITMQPAKSHFVNVGYRHRPTTDEFAGVGNNDSPDVATNNEGTNRVLSANWNWFIGSRTTFDVKYLHMDEESESIAVKELPFQPAFDVNNLAGMGQFTQSGITIGANNLALNRQNYQRDEVKATFSQFFDMGATSHQLKAGFGFEDGLEDLTRRSNGWGILARVQSNTRIAATYYPEQPGQLGKARTYSLFLQDDITIGNRLVINAGLLANRDEFAQELADKNTFLTFDFSDEIQPRIGFNYQLRKSVGDKVYANFGRYYALDQKSTARSLAPGRLYTEEALFDNAGTLISKVPAANTTGKVIDGDLQPPFMDEWVVGYATPFLGRWSLDVFFLHRDSDDFIEDIPTVLPNSSYVYKNDPFADRKFKTVTAEVNRPLSNNWAMNVSYAWSRLSGNYDQDYSGGLGGAAVFNTSSLINDGPGSFTSDTNRQGVLSQDRTHVMKGFLTYMPPVVKNLTIGAYLRGQSGTPWEARGLPWGSTATYLRYLEPAGTNRNDFWFNSDLLLAYGIGVGRSTLKLEGRVLNVIGDQTALLRDNRKYLDGRIRTIVGTPDPACLSCWTDAMVQGTTQPNPNFGQPSAYASPRRFLLTALWEF